MATTKQNKATLTPDQQAIADRSNAQDKQWHTISEDDLNDFSLMTNILDLPKEAASLQEREIYAFCWRERTADRIDELTRSVAPPLRWGIVNKTTVPELGEYVDPMLGCIPRLDQILLYKPWAHHIIVQKAKMELAEVGLNTGSLEGKKHQIENRDEDVKVFTGPEHKISGSDVVIDDGGLIDNDGDSSPLGDLVTQ